MLAVRLDTIDIRPNTLVCTTAQRPFGHEEPRHLVSNVFSADDSVPGMAWFFFRGTAAEFAGDPGMYVFLLHEDPCHGTVAYYAGMKCIRTNETLHLHDTDRRAVLARCFFEQFMVFGYSHKRYRSLPDTRKDTSLIKDEQKEFADIDIFFQAYLWPWLTHLGDHRLLAQAKQAMNENASIPMYARIWKSMTPKDRKKHGGFAFFVIERMVDDVNHARGYFDAFPGGFVHN